MSAVMTLLGLLVILLLFSLLLCVLLEVLAGWLALRGRLLEKNLMGLLSAADRRRELWQAFGNSALYQQASGKAVGKGRPPAYLSPWLFRQILVDVINRQHPEADMAAKLRQLPDEDLRSVLLQFWESSYRSHARFYQQIEHWYTDLMERGRSWYRQRIQAIGLLLGVALAAAFNLDIIAVFRYFSGQYAELGLGWGAWRPANELVFWLLKGTGWLLTALCLVKGASFWYDLRKKLISTRPDTSPTKAPTDAELIIAPNPAHLPAELNAEEPELEIIDKPVG